MKKIFKNIAPYAVGIVAVTGFATTAMAQRDPAYEAARSSGVIGEQVDGYIGFVGTPSASVRAMVEDLNIKRKAAYTRRAQATNATVSDYAFTSGCNLISSTVPGEKYQTPSGSWETRTSAAPKRDARCP